MEKGKIYRVDKSQINVFGYRHYFIYLDDYDNIDTFIGVMLTHAAGIRNYNNISLSNEHIKEYDAIGNRYPFQFENSHIVPTYLIKDSNLPIGDVQGELTEQGLLFLNSVLINCSPEHFIDVYNRVNN